MFCQIILITIKQKCKHARSPSTILPYSWWVF